MKTLAACVFLLLVSLGHAQNEKQGPVSKEPPYYPGPYAQRTLIHINTDTLHASEKKSNEEKRPEKAPEKKTTDKQAPKKED